MPVLRERNDLDKKPTWFLFLAANVLIVLGCAITWILIRRSSADMKYFWLPCLISNLLALVLAGFFVWLEVKDLQPKILHFQRKWFKFYIVAMSMFVAAIMFNSIFYLGFLRDRTPAIMATGRNWELIVYLVVTAVLTLLAIGFQRYARFRIDLDVYRRKRGAEIKNPDDAKPEDKKEEKADLVKEENKPEEVKEKTDVNAPTGGLLDQMDK